MWYRETLEIVRARLTLREAAAAGRTGEAQQALARLGALAAAEPSATDLGRECERWRVRLDQMMEDDASPRAA